MLSRVANALFWLARYLERAENSARILAITHGYAQELRAVSHTAADQCWAMTRHLMGDDTEALGSGTEVFWRLCFDDTVPTSVRACVTRARENARGIRDAISSEMWREINVLFLRFSEEAEMPRSESAQLELLQRVRSVSHLFQGLRDNTMCRGDEWHFLCVGQYLERAGMTARTLDAMLNHPAIQVAAKLGQSIDTAHLVATLRMCTAYETFVRAGHMPGPESVEEFLLLEARFPRSVKFCVQEVGNSLHALSGTPLEIYSNDAEQMCGRLVAELRFVSISEIVDQGLHEYLLRLIGRLDQIGDAIVRMYF
jgi:uncharacterized alpha-E superfamily protein